MTSLKKGDILVNTRQRGNPILNSLKEVTFSLSKDIIPDFIMGEDTCALYLSMRYHLLHPEYVYSRMSELKRGFTLKVLLCILDAHNSSQPLVMVTSLASANDFTVIVCWSNSEAARYLEMYKMHQKTSAESIQHKLQNEYAPRLDDVLSTIRSVNKSDVKVLSENFGSLKQMMQASMEELALCNGIGDKKVQRIYEAFNLPFI